jgi:hypothetical protein
MSHPKGLKKNTQKERKSETLGRHGALTAMNPNAALNSIELWPWSSVDVIRMNATPKIKMHG